MNDDELWAAIDDQRRRTADLLRHLGAAEWAHPSLCEGWSVRDVAAHLTEQQLGLGDILRMAIRHRGGLNEKIAAAASAKAAAPTEQLIAEIRAMMGSRRHNLGVTSRETLVDILVHSQDIALPLRRDLPLDPTAAAEAARRVWASLGTRQAAVFRRVGVEGVRLVATDAALALGEGAEVRGPAAAILLTLTGRPAGQAQLEGPGLAVLNA